LTLTPGAASNVAYTTGVASLIHNQSVSSLSMVTTSEYNASVRIYGTVDDGTPSNIDVTFSGRIKGVTSLGIYIKVIDSTHAIFSFYDGVNQRESSSQVLSSALGASPISTITFQYDIELSPCLSQEYSPTMFTTVQAVTPGSGNGVTPLCSAIPLTTLDSGFRTTVQRSFHLYVSGSLLFKSLGANVGTIDFSLTSMHYTGSEVFNSGINIAILIDDDTSLTIGFSDLDSPSSIIAGVEIGSNRLNILFPVGGDSIDQVVPTISVAKFVSNYKYT